MRKQFCLILVAVFLSMSTVVIAAEEPWCGDFLEIDYAEQAVTVMGGPCNGDSSCCTLYAQEIANHCITVTGPAMFMQLVQQYCANVAQNQCGPLGSVNPTCITVVLQDCMYNMFNGIALQQFLLANCSPMAEAAYNACMNN